MKPADQTMHGKICLITGATAGIGLVTARELAQRGATLVIVGRNPAKTAAVVTQLQAETGNRAIEFLIADLSCQLQIHELAKEFKERHPRLDVLINNAGGAWRRRQLSVDGVEMTIAVNHLAPFLLTHLLLNQLEPSMAGPLSPRNRGERDGVWGGARIINLSSIAHRFASLDWDDLMAEKSYTGYRQYCRSKLMTLMFTIELARRLSATNITANAVHPGFVRTAIARDFGWQSRFFDWSALLFGISAAKGARTVIWLATAPEVAGISGQYFVRQHVAKTSATARDEAAARRLWDWSMEMTHLAEPLATDETRIKHG